MNGLWRDIRLGWEAPFADILAGMFLAMAVTAPLAVVLALATPIDGSALTALAAVFQLGATYAVAGRRARRRLPEG